MADIKDTKFKSVADIDTFFKNYNSSGFTDWFIKNHGGKGGFAAYGSKGSKTITNTDKWKQVWSHIPDLFGRTEINLVEFLAINTIMINETGGSFKPLSEGVNKNSASSHPGIAYAFDTISGLKKSYNTLTDVKNKTAYDLFHDADFKSAHKHKPFGNILADTTDVRWKSNAFPVGFSGNAEKEVDRDLKSNTFISESDFHKFRGRGFIQTTGRSAYIKILDFISTYTGSNSTILKYKQKWSSYGNNTDRIATISTNADWDDLFTNTDSIIPCYAVYIHGKGGGYLSISTSSDSQVKSGVRKVASKIAGGNATEYINKFEERVLQQLNMLENKPAPEAAKEESNTNQVDNTTPPTTPPNDNDTFDTNSEDEDAAFLKFLEESDKEEINSTGNPDDSTKNNSNENNEQPTNGNVTNVAEPTVKISSIKIDVPGDEQSKAEVAGNLGFYPFVYYNGIQIQYEDIRSFNLSSTDLLPTVSFTFFDSTGLMEQAGFPLDDTKVKVFINPRKQGFKPILIEFKIENFTVTANKTYIIDGIMNVNRFFLKKYESFSGKTSYDTLLDFCKKAEIGFNSNIKNTDDRMNWINTGESGFDFVNSIINHSYISDSGFMWGYVDFYYCFNYVDIETELNRNVDSIDGLDGTGGIEKGLAAKNGDGTQKLFLTNDKSMADSANYFSTYNLMNNSTSISLKKGFLNRVKFYDRDALDFMIYDIDSITSEGSKTIILKGSPQDEDYFKEHVTSTLMGKLDTDNMHKNYYYAYVQNSQNIEDLAKIGIKLTLPSPNFNLFRFQKIRVIVSNNTQKFAKDMINYRLSGGWMITDISFIMTDGKFRQELILVKRELELSPQELKEQQGNKASNNPNNTSASPTPASDSNDNSYDKAFPENDTSNIPGAGGIPANADVVFTENGPQIDNGAIGTASQIGVGSQSFTSGSGTSSATQSTPTTPTNKIDDKSVISGISIDGYDPSANSTVYISFRYSGKQGVTLNLDSTASKKQKGAIYITTDGKKSKLADIYMRSNGENRGVVFGSGSDGNSEIVLTGDSKNWKLQVDLDDDEIIKLYNSSIIANNSNISLEWEIGPKSNMMFSKSLAK